MDSTIYLDDNRKTKSSIFLWGTAAVHTIPVVSLFVVSSNALCIKYTPRHYLTTYCTYFSTEKSLLLTIVYIYAF